jgi:hypothetical protein
MPLRVRLATPLRLLMSFASLRPETAIGRGSPDWMTLIIESASIKLGA